MELKAALFCALISLLCVSDPVLGGLKGRHHKQYREGEEAENVELEPDIKTAASLSHAMLQQLTDAVRTLIPLKEQVAEQKSRIDAIYNISMDTKQYFDSAKKNESVMEEMREEITRMARKVTVMDTECADSLEHCRQNTKNALSELRHRCDEETAAVEKKWRDKMQELSSQKGGQLSEMQQGCETQSLQLQTQCFSKMMDLSREADKNIEELRLQNERLQARVDELTAKVGICGPEKVDFNYQGNVAKSAKGRELDKLPRPANSAEECEGYADASAPVPPSATESGMNVGNNKQYILGERKVTWEEANTLCRSRGMWLLTQESERDKHLLNVHIQKLVGAQAATFWMSARKEEGETWFMWQCYASNQRPWRHNQHPKTDERCAYVTYQRGGKGVWADDPCDVTHRYICQKNVY